MHWKPTGRSYNEGFVEVGCASWKFVIFRSFCFGVFDFCDFF